MDEAMTEVLEIESAAATSQLWGKLPLPLPTGFLMEVLLHEGMTAGGKLAAIGLAVVFADAEKRGGQETTIGAARRRRIAARIGVEPDEVMRALVVLASMGVVELVDLATREVREEVADG